MTSKRNSKSGFKQEGKSETFLVKFFKKPRRSEGLGEWMEDAVRIHSDDIVEWIRIKGEIWNKKFEAFLVKHIKQG